VRLGIIGATGLVGREVLVVLQEMELQLSSLRLYSSSNSAGKNIQFNGTNYVVSEMSEAAFNDNDAFICSAGSDAAIKWGNIARQQNCIFIDNSSAWRMDESVPLIVPEINPKALGDHDYIISNPNCSTIQLVMALDPLHLKYGIKRVIVSTYQSVSGSGKNAVEQLRIELEGKQSENPAYPHQIAFNCLPHIDYFLDDGYTKEENKMIRETSKIMGAEIPLTTTCVRVPSYRGHAEAVNVELNSSYAISELRSLWEKSPGIIVQDNPGKNLYPMQKTAANSDAVFIGRIREDNTNAMAINFWVVADNLRKGAATNAVQIFKLWMEEQ